MPPRGYLTLTCLIGESSDKIKRERKTEVIAGIIAHIFKPLVEAVCVRDGFISGFAGDAITALFPAGADLDQYLRQALAADPGLPGRLLLHSNQDKEKEMAIFPLPHASTAEMTLEAVLTQLSQHPNVDGLVTVGSTGQSSFTPFSDYDVLIVLSEMPVPLQVGITYIDHRLTDLLFATTAQLDQIIATETVLERDEWEGQVAYWLMTGQVMFDRHGSLGQAKIKLCSGKWFRSFEDIDAYGAWIGVNFNLLHTRRLLKSDDPVKLQAAELRMSLYGVGSLLYSYFRIRKLPWEGDKAAIRYFMQHDPAYLELLQQFLRQSDPARKFDAYEQVATATLAPISRLWSGEPTILWNDMVPATWETLAQGLNLWEVLISSSNASSDTRRETSEVRNR